MQRLWLSEAAGFLINASMVTVSLVWRTSMFRNTRVQMLAVLAAGALLGYLAASGRLDPRRAEASPSTQQTAEKPAVPCGDRPGCCDGAARNNLLALARKDEKDPPAGKKPN